MTIKERIENFKNENKWYYSYIDGVIFNLKEKLEEIYKREDFEKLDIKYFKGENIALLYCDYIFKSEVTNYDLAKIRLPILIVDFNLGTIDLLKKFYLGEFNNFKNEINKYNNEIKNEINKKIKKYKNKINNIFPYFKAKNEFIISYFKKELNCLNNFEKDINKIENCFSIGMIDRVVNSFKKELDFRLSDDYKLTTDYHSKEILDEINNLKEE